MGWNIGSSSSPLSAHRMYNRYFSLQNRFRFLNLVNFQARREPTAKHSFTNKPSTCPHTHTAFNFPFSALPLILSHHQLGLDVSPHHLYLSSTSFSHWNYFPFDKHPPLPQDVNSVTSALNFQTRDVRVDSKLVKTSSSINSF